MALRNGELRKVFQEAFCEVGHRRTAPEVEVGFYPFAGLNNYILVRNGKAYVKLSDILLEAPRPVHRALACILVGKLFQRPPDEEAEDIYREYINIPAIARTIEKVQRQRGRKRIMGAQGRVRDLQKAFQKLNRTYFKGQLKMPRLTWSAKRTHRILGHMDRVHNTLVISRTLDDARVPQFFFEYILYHEMLHLKHAPRKMGYRYYYHTPEFNKEEQQFRFFDQAQKWLEKIGTRR
jgi:hypothetical protein